MMLWRIAAILFFLATVYLAFTSAATSRSMYKLSGDLQSERLLGAQRAQLLAGFSEHFGKNVPRDEVLRVLRLQKGVSPAVLKESDTEVSVFAVVFGFDSMQRLQSITLELGE